MGVGVGLGKRLYMEVCLVHILVSTWKYVFTESGVHMVMHAFAYLY